MPTLCRSPPRQPICPTARPTLTLAVLTIQGHCDRAEWSGFSGDLGAMMAMLALFRVRGRLPVGRRWPPFRAPARQILFLKQAGATQFGNPEALVVDSQNRLYVADTYNHRVWVFNNVSATGQQPNFVFGAQGDSTALENVFQFTRGMAIDSQKPPLSYRHI